MGPDSQDSKQPTSRWESPSQVRGALDTIAITREASVFSYSGGNNKTGRIKICPSLDGTTCESTSRLAYVAVYCLEVAASGQCTLPTMALSTSGSFYALEVQDASLPFVVIFTFNGATASSGSFSTSYSGNAQPVAAGVAAGTMKVTRNGSDVCTGITVTAGNQTLECASIASGTLALAVDSGGPAPVVTTGGRIGGGRLGGGRVNQSREPAESPRLPSVLALATLLALAAAARRR